MTTILLGIDGTGPLADAVYQAEMHTSFVRYIVRSSPAKAKRYERGPTNDGLDMAAIVGKGYTYVHLNLVAEPKAQVLLVGYSRGGAGVIGVAQRLAKDNVKVSAMVLFDAVDRAIGIDALEIPNNVERVVHARRDPYAFSRNTFGNCGTKWQAPTKYEVKYFRGTHGAVGGVPWPTPKGARSTDMIKERGEATPTLINYTQDAYAAKEVWAWVRPRLAAYGFIGTQAGAAKAPVS